MPKGRRSAPAPAAPGAAAASVPSAGAAAATLTPPLAPAGAASPSQAPPDEDGWREDAAWFRRLPPAIQDEYRARWRGEEERAALRVVRAKDTRWQVAARGAVVFALVSAMFGGGGWVQLGVSFVVGAAIGRAWLAVEAGPFLHILLGTPVWMAIDLAFAGGAADRILALFGMTFHASLCVIVAQIREWRRSDGDEV